MLTAITRAVSPAMNRCELAYRSREAIDVTKAAAQHRAYEDCLRGLGVSVVSLPPAPRLPDAVFVEDPAVVVDEMAVITRMGAASRKPEAESLAEVLEKWRPVRWLREPATLEGGDVMRVGRTVFVGASARSNAEGIAQLTAELTPHGYSVRAVEVRGCLHLKTGCCYLGDGAVLANAEWVDVSALPGLRVIGVDADEPWAANVLRIGETIVMPDSFPRTRHRLERDGWRVRTLDISELMKAEGGLTCMSIVFSGGIL